MSEHDEQKDVDGVVTPVAGTDVIEGAATPPAEAELSEEEGKVLVAAFLRGEAIDPGVVIMHEGSRLVAVRK